MFDAFEIHAMQAQATRRAPGAQPLDRGRLPMGRLLEVGVALWVVLLLLLPVLLFGNLPPGLLERQFVDIRTHTLIESFCGFVALVIAVMVLTVSAKRRIYSGTLFGGAFLVMGVMDVLHAWADPNSALHDFVAYHTLSYLFGGALILAGIVTHAVVDRKRWPTRGDLFTVGAGIALLLIVAALYPVFIPNLMTGNYPPGLLPAHNAHYLAGLLYAIDAVAFYGYYRKFQQWLALVVASLLLVFAQSAYLFNFSHLWDVIWWGWHGTKLLFYLGVMLTVSIGFLLALDTIERSRHALVQANRRLRSTQRRIRNINQALRIRNRMARGAMTPLTLSNALDVIAKAIEQLLGISQGELILNISADEVDEFERSMPHQVTSRWPIRVKPVGTACLAANCRLVRGGGGRYYECASGAGQSICLILTASGQTVGHLRLFTENRVQLRQRMIQLQTLTAEIGTIVNNALLYYRWQNANEFQAALLRVSTMMTSTLNLEQVLGSVCRESAALLDSDGALVWLPRKDGPGQFNLAARWLACNGDGDRAAELESWCRDGRACGELLKSIDGQFRPCAMLWPDDPVPPAVDRTSACHWGALALFPLLDEARLIGVMVLVRRNRVQFSAATLAKGELLAGQVRIAINNAHSYRQLSEINEQLKRSEAEKIRAERLAALGQMAASVAHEVRNPLSAITNCLAVLKTERGEDDRSRDALEIIQDEVVRLDNLTRDFLTFGKPRVMANKPVVLTALVHKVCAALERHVRQQGLPIEVAAGDPGNTAAHLFDADGLEVVLWNLLLNASQAIQGPGRVYATVRTYPGCFLLLVEDTGRGIAAAERKQIFEPFYTRRAHGAGLGLAIVQRFVQEWGGRVRIESRIGHGTRFCIRVPLAQWAETVANRTGTTA